MTSRYLTVVDPPMPAPDLRAAATVAAFLARFGSPLARQILTRTARDTDSPRRAR